MNENIQILTGTAGEVKPQLEAYLGSHPNARIIGYAICSQPKKTPAPDTAETATEEPEEHAAKPAPKGKKTAASAGQEAAKQPEPLAAVIASVEIEHEIIHSYTLAYVF